MAKGASSVCLFLYLLFVLIVSSSGTLVGFLYDARKSSAIPSANETISFLNQNKVPPSQIRVLVEDYRVLDSFSKTDVLIDLYLNETLAVNLRKHKLSAISWLKTNLLTSLPHGKIKNIVVSCSRNNELPMVLSALESIRSRLDSFHLESEVKVSLSISLSILENLNRKNERYLSKAFDFINRTRSFVVVESKIDGQLSMGDQFVEYVIKRATVATSALRYNDVSLVLIVKSSAFPSGKEVAEFSSKISRSLKNKTNIIGKKVVGLFAEVSPRKDFERKELEREEEQMFHASHRELINNLNTKTTQHDFVYPPTTTFPVTPITNPATTPVTVPPANAVPAIVIVPGMNPVTVIPNAPSTAVPLPNTYPVSSPLPTTNPVTTPSTNSGGHPVNNPVTTYPAPTVGVPVTTPIATPMMPPATGNAPAVLGQRWCVAKTGASQTALQTALDYACGPGGAYCLTIQQSGSCYNPNTLQNHASYAFNSYYQKNLGQTSCDFGGAAMITNINPSTGSCIYPSSSSSTSSPTPITNPATTPVTVPPANAAPAIVTVPGMNPVTVIPNAPSTAVPLPNTYPVSSPLPITNPVTTPSTNSGGHPVTNPVTTYPAPTVGVPVTTPIATPVMPPATGNAPAVLGQSWCVAKTGASQTALQTALDYACGPGGADCLTIQQNGSCYNPNTLQNHASYAFNSYYQKNPGQTSCDFGGAAMITTINPSTGSCIYPSSSSSTSSPTPVNPTPVSPTPVNPTPVSPTPVIPTPVSPTPVNPTPVSPTPVNPTPVSPTPVNPTPVSPTPVNPTPVSPTPTTASNGGAVVPGSVSPPPAVLNGSNPPLGIPIGFGEIPPSGFGENPPTVNGTTSMSTSLQPCIECIILVASIITGKFILDI